MDDSSKPGDRVEKGRSPCSGERNQSMTADVHPLPSAQPESRPGDEASVLAAEAGDLVRRMILLFFRSLRGATRAPQSSSEDWLSISDGAKHAGVGTSTLREWIARNELPVGRHRGTVRVRKSDIDGLLIAGGRESLPGQADDRRLHPRAAEILSKSEDA